jgi:hypothetical protein
MTVCQHRPLILLLTLSCLSLHAFGSRVNITNNGYRDIVVAISPDVKPDEADDLLDKIKVKFNSFLIAFYFSLFKATNKAIQQILLKKVINHRSFSCFVRSNAESFLH